MTGVRWASFAMAIAGVILCSDIDYKSLNLGAGYLYGNSLIFLGTLGSAIYNSYGKKLLERYTPMKMLFFTYLAMFVIMTPLVSSMKRRSFSVFRVLTL